MKIRKYTNPNLDTPGLSDSEAVSDFFAFGILFLPEDEVIGAGW